MFASQKKGGDEKRPVQKIDELTLIPAEVLHFYKTVQFTHVSNDTIIFLFFNLMRKLLEDPALSFYRNWEYLPAEVKKIQPFFTANPKLYDEYKRFQKSFSMAAINAENLLFGMGSVSAFSWDKGSLDEENGKRLVAILEEQARFFKIEVEDVNPDKRKKILETILRDNQLRSMSDQKHSAVLSKEFDSIRDEGEVQNYRAYIELQFLTADTLDKAQEESLHLIVSFLQRAAKKGIAPAQIALGLLYEQLGMRVIAEKLYLAARKQKIPEAYYRLGMLYRSLSRTEYSLKFLKIAASYEHQDALFQLAEYYRKRGESRVAARYASRVSPVGRIESVSLFLSAGEILNNWIKKLLQQKEISYDSQEFLPHVFLTLQKEHIYRLQEEYYKKYGNVGDSFYLSEQLNAEVSCASMAEQKNMEAAKAIAIEELREFKAGEVDPGNFVVMQQIALDDAKLKTNKSKQSTGSLMEVKVPFVPDVDTDQERSDFKHVVNEAGPVLHLSISALDDKEMDCKENDESLARRLAMDEIKEFAANEVDVANLISVEQKKPATDLGNLVSVMQEIAAEEAKLKTAKKKKIAGAPMEASIPGGSAEEAKTSSTPARQSTASSSMNLFSEDEKVTEVATSVVQRSIGLADHKAAKVAEDPTAKTTLAPIVSPTVYMSSNGPHLFNKNAAASVDNGDSKLQAKDKPAIKPA